MSPFIMQERREFIKDAEEANNLDIVKLEPGDFCYLEYKDMVEKWKANPRWTTAHNIYKDVTQDCSIAKDLAWQIFFIWHVVPYEQEAEKRNGRIE